MESVKEAESQVRETSKTEGESHIGHVIRATGYSLEGLGAAWKHEMAFRIECVLVILMLPWVFLIPVPWLMRGMLLFSLFLVLIVELLNSGLEWVIDYISQERHPFAKRVKDMGSAAVFLSLAHCGFQWGLAILIWLNILP